MFFWNFKYEEKLVADVDLPKAGLTVDIGDLFWLHSNKPLSIFGKLST